MSESLYGYNNKERNLLLKSHHVKADFPTFYEFLQENKKAPILTQTEQKRDKTIALILSRTDQTMAMIIETAKMEWELLVKNYIPVCTDDPKMERSCELCGHPHLRFQHRIINRYNKNQMIIGSECVNEYQIGWENPEIRSNMEEQIKDLRNMNLATKEMNNRTKNGIIRINASIRSWKILPYLPSSQTAKDIISIVDEATSMLIQIKTTKLPHKDADVFRCKNIAARLESLIERSRQETAQKTTGWRVSNAVYQWAVKRDADNKDNKLLPLLLKKSRITSENVAFIMEEGHKKECMERLVKGMPEQIRLDYAPEQPNRIKVYFKDRNVEYPFWVTYGSLIKCVAKHGFPDKNELSPFSKTDFIAMEAIFDRRDGVAGTNYLRDLIQEEGGSIQEENERGDLCLIRLNQNGVILDIDAVAIYFSRSILTGDRTDVKKKIHMLFYGKKPASFHTVKQNWDEIYGQRNRY